MKLAKQLRKTANKAIKKGPPKDLIEAVDLLDQYSELGFTNTELWYKPTKKNRILVELLLEYFHKEGFRVWFNDDRELKISLEWHRD